MNTLALVLVVSLGYITTAGLVARGMAWFCGDTAPSDGTVVAAAIWPLLALFWGAIGITYITVVILSTLFQVAAGRKATMFLTECGNFNDTLKRYSHRRQLKRELQVRERELVADRLLSIACEKYEHVRHRSYCESNFGGRCDCFGR